MRTSNGVTMKVPQRVRVDRYPLVILVWPLYTKEGMCVVSLVGLILDVDWSVYLGVQTGLILDALRAKTTTVFY